MDWLVRAQRFETAAHGLLSKYESSADSRVIKLEQSYDQLDLLNLKQDDLFRQSLRCVEQKLFRAAHVMCWVACMDFILETLDGVGIDAILTAYPKWQKVKSVRELAEYVPEAQLVDALGKLGLATKGQIKSFAGLLHRRNECAHPTAYLPELNETLGYIAETLNRIQDLKKTT
jgi:hypothetical protein